jgi:hypothetical protein
MRNDLVSDRRRAVFARRRPSLRAILAGVLALVLLGALAKWAYNRFLRSDEDRIRGLIQSAAQAARERRPSGVTAVLADEFVLRGPPDLDRDTCHRILVSLLMRELVRCEVALTPEPVPVTVSEDRGTARCEFQARVRGKWTEESDWVDLNARAGGSIMRCTFKLREKVWKLAELSIISE